MIRTAALLLLLSAACLAAPAHAEELALYQAMYRVPGSTFVIQALAHGWTLSATRLSNEGDCRVEDTALIADSPDGVGETHCRFELAPPAPGHLAQGWVMKSMRLRPDPAAGSRRGVAFARDSRLHDTDQPWFIMDIHLNGIGHNVWQLEEAEFQGPHPLPWTRALTP